MWRLLRNSTARAVAVFSAACTIPPASDSPAALPAQVLLADACRRRSNGGPRRRRAARAAATRLHRSTGEHGAWDTHSRHTGSRNVILPPNADHSQRPAFPEERRRTGMNLPRAAEASPRLATDHLS
jgi:hypothetical protein